MINETSPKRSRGPWIGLITGVVIGASLAGALFFTPLGKSLTGASTDHAHAGEAGDGQLWTCGMHPNVIQDEPGTCPICSMDLVPLRQGNPSAGGAAPGSGERKILFYRNPMDPTITSPVPAKDSMGMDYVPVYEDEVDQAGGDGATVHIDPSVQQNMNVIIEPVRRRDLRRPIRTVGYLDYDQENMVSVTTKYEGFVERTWVNYIGQEVKKGEPLFEVYSPELVQTEEELLSALDYARRMKRTSATAAARARALVEAARRRLRLWDITPAQIAELEQTGKVFRTLKVVAPAGGIVMRRMPGLEGMAIRPGMELMHIADLTSLWLNVEVFESQLPWIDIDQRASIVLNYFPGEQFEGKVRFIEPSVTERTRTVTLTLQVPNIASKLRVGMYATVHFQPIVARNAIAVPSHAVIRTGTRNIIVVSLGEGRFAPREVELGAEGEGWVQVVSGLTDMDRIVTSSQFLIDSESSLQEAIQKLIAARKSGK
ncbi:MAG: efflux RND transporter periplasmic adaptor subunit [Acidobacteriota bacterium]|nr:efflux RND transporter periplasmic adaptor subunit [Acidobacteriota bacterium]